MDRIFAKIGLADTPGEVLTALCRAIERFVVCVERTCAQRVTTAVVEIFTVGEAIVIIIDVVATHFKECALTGWIIGARVVLTVNQPIQVIINVVVAHFQ